MQPVTVDGLTGNVLAEVFLLLDNISATQTKKLPESMGDDALFKEDSGKGWLEQVCDIHWPSTEGHTSEARDAAKLLRVRDMLNGAAAPATGYTIAFTLMMAGETPESTAGRWRARWGWPPLVFEAADQPASPPAASRLLSSRREFAAKAFPVLEQTARGARRQWWLLRNALAIWLALTCVFSWHIAAGVTLAERWRTQHEEVQRLQTLADAQSAPGDDSVPVDDAADANGNETAAPAAAAPGPPSGKAGPGLDPSLKVQKGHREAAQRTLSEARTIEAAASNNLLAWVREEGKTSICFLSAIGWHAERPCLSWLAGKDPRTGSNLEWAVIYVGLLAGTVLPIFYGVLGAWAAVVRAISAKMRGSTLSPRDVQRAGVQLVLGAVIACCIGLFVPGGERDEQSGLFGSIPLTLSALCFIAGFGVEGVFQTLEELVRRVFNLEPAAPVPPPS